MNCMMLIKTATATIAVPIRVPVLVSDEDSFCPSAKCKKIVFFSGIRNYNRYFHYINSNIFVYVTSWCPLNLLTMLNTLYFLIF